jgi:hypothetical protein
MADIRSYVPFALKFFVKFLKKDIDIILEFRISLANTAYGVPKNRVPGVWGKTV